MTCDLKHVQHTSHSLGKPIVSFYEQGKKLKKKKYVVPILEMLYHEYGTYMFWEHVVFTICVPIDFKVEFQ
jgi:hypothetical protein